MVPVAMVPVATGGRLHIYKVYFNSTIRDPIVHSTRLSLMLDQLAVNELATRQLARRHAHLIDLLTTEDASDRLNVRQVGPRLSEVLEDDPHDTGQRDCEKPAHNPP